METIHRMFSKDARLLLVFGLGPVLANAQHANVWYFGEQAGIGFPNGIPVPLTNGALVSYEASASICDENGELLFYTNGGPLNSPGWEVGAVYDRQHNIMPNGLLTSGGGCNSSAQGALIVQDPGNPDQYYLFTTDCTENALAGGLRYCKVDMTLNGGLGDVIIIGTPVLANVQEPMTGIRHANGTDVWVITHGVSNSELQAVLVTSSGIGTPVTTTLGPNTGLYAGQFSASLDGTKVHYGAASASILFDFDPATGVFSNPIDLNHLYVGAGAFANGGQFLYTAQNIAPRQILQYDLLAADIPASEVLIGAGDVNQGTMQRGPDGRIYVSRNNRTKLGVITNPNAAGLAADFQLEGFDLNGRECAQGLPNFVNDLLAPIATGIRTAPAPAPLHCWLTDAGLRIRTSNGFGPEGFSILRSDGALVHQGRLSGESSLVPVSSFGPGFYAVRVIGSNGAVAVGSFVVGL